MEQSRSGSGRSMRARDFLNKAMAIGRFILRFQGPGPRPDEDVEHIRALRDATVLDSSARMLLVEAPEAEIRALVDTMPYWVMAPEQLIRLPDLRPKLRRGQKGKLKSKPGMK